MYFVLVALILFCIEAHFSTVQTGGQPYRDTSS